MSFNAHWIFWLELGNNKGSFILRQLLASILTCGLLLVSCDTSQPTGSDSDPLKTPWEDRSIFENGLVSQERSVLNELDGASVYHIEFNIAADLQQITGAQEVRYTNNEGVALGEVQFHLFPNILGGEMTVSSVKVNNNEVSYEVGNSVMRVPLRPTLLLLPVKHVGSPADLVIMG